MTLYSSVIRKKNTSEFLTVLFRITRTTHYLFISRVMTEINYPTSKVGLQCAVLSFVFAEQDPPSPPSAALNGLVRLVSLMNVPPLKTPLPFHNAQLLF